MFDDYTDSSLCNSFQSVTYHHQQQQQQNSKLLQNYNVQYTCPYHCMLYNTHCLQSLRHIFDLFKGPFGDQQPHPKTL